MKVVLLISPQVWEVWLYPKAPQTFKVAEILALLTITAISHNFRINKKEMLRDKLRLLMILKERQEKGILMLYLIL